jgi:hypothetical protein
MVFRRSLDAEMVQHYIATALILQRVRSLREPINVRGVVPSPCFCVGRLRLRAEHDTAVESYSPLMQGGEALEHPVIVNLARRYGKTAAQIILRWHVQSGFIVIPKSVRPERIRENLDLFDFELSQDEMRTIAGMDKGRRIGSDPDTACFK